MKRWSILYRGPLSSCNYACDYCPFAKTRNTRAELADDARRLERFVDWVEGRRGERVGVLFTPWGEALIRRPYRDAMRRLSRMEHVYRVAIQTNLSFGPDWVDGCDLEALSLWTTWHPTQTSMSGFLERVRGYRDRGVELSVGVVGFREAFDEIEQLRRELPADVYLWVNAYKREPGYYAEEDIRRIEALDPLFRYNTRYHPSQGAACQGGESMFTVDGEGDVRRCHFIAEPIANIYEPGFEDALRPRACTNQKCGCHIGYVHMDHLGLYETYGDGVLERIPRAALWSDRAGAVSLRERARQNLPEGPAPGPR